MKKLPTIYLDMDGVLFDFVKNIEKTTGLTINQWTNLGRKERWDPIIKNKKFIFIFAINPNKIFVFIHRLCMINSLLHNRF